MRFVSWLALDEGIGTKLCDQRSGGCFHFPLSDAAQPEWVPSPVTEAALGGPLVVQVKQGGEVRLKLGAVDAASSTVVIDQVDFKSISLEAAGLERVSGADAPQQLQVETGTDGMAEMLLKLRTDATIGDSESSACPASLCHPADGCIEVVTCFTYQVRSLTQISERRSVVVQMRPNLKPTAGSAYAVNVDGETGWCACVRACTFFLRACTHLCMCKRARTYGAGLNWARLMRYVAA